MGQGRTPLLDRDYGLAKATRELDLILCIRRKYNDQSGKNKLFNKIYSDYSFKTPIAKIGRANLYQISSSFDMQIVDVYTCLFQTQVWICRSFSSQKVYSHKQYMCFLKENNLRFYWVLRACKHKAIGFAAGSKGGGGGMFCPCPFDMGEK